jgi:alkylhydroperoxidase/carboxymuconolactone decarboxylase family protein YurZ
MDTTDIIAIIGIASVINWVILYFIINSATNSESKLVLSYIQFELLSQIALKNGVTEETIKTIIDKHNK